MSKNFTILEDQLAVTGPAEEAGTMKHMYSEHLPLPEIQQGQKSGKFLQGTFHASRENWEEAWVNIKDQELRVFLASRLHQNRAVEGDEVAVEMLPESEWGCPSSEVKLEEDAEEEEDDDLGNEESPKKNPVPMELRQPTGKVVGIIQQNWRQYCGILQVSDLSRSNRHRFKPYDRKIPWIHIETHQAQKLKDQHIIVAIDSWPRNSKNPMGHLVRHLGGVGDKATEKEVLLLEHDVPHSEFSEDVLSFLPKMPWTITEEDREKRTDLQHISICSVDPPGCKNIDDALHCRQLENGNYEVGVHIADVSHFIRPGSALDEEAASRGTTVYLGNQGDQRIDMVPEQLSSNLCSLRSNVERFAITVLWEVDEEAEILSVSFCKSIICSRASLTYAEAQMRIDDPSMKDDITISLRLLNKLANILKRRRKENGAPSSSSTEVRFHVDSKTHDMDVQAKELGNTKSMVEEFMLLANITVAKKITEEFPQCALLRRHPAPSSSIKDPLIATPLSKGFEKQVSSNRELWESLDLAEFPHDSIPSTMLDETSCMKEPAYFCSGMLPPEQYAHYSLGTPIYTHFTSPIRRYPDIIVHRLLAVCINADSSYPELLDKNKTQALCSKLNYRHKMAQYAARAHVNLCTRLKLKSSVKDVEGDVLSVKKNALVVFIPKYELEGTIFLAGKDITVPFYYNVKENTQTCGHVVFNVSHRVVVQLSIDQSNVEHLKLVEPKIEGFSVPPAIEKQPASDCGSPAPAKKAKTAEGSSLSGDTTSEL